LRQTAQIEEGGGFRKGIAGIPKYLNLNTIGGGLTAAAFGLTGVPLILIAAAENGQLTSAQTTSWIFAVYLIGGGFIGLTMALYYQRPIVGAWTIPGAAMIGPILANFNLEAAAGAYFMSGVAVLLIGLSGQFRKLVAVIPTPIIMAMIAGVLIDFSISIIPSFQSSYIVVGLGILGYVVFTSYFERIPGIIGAIVLGTAAAVFQGQTAMSSVDVAIATPNLIFPAFSIDSMISIGVPLTVMVLGAENMQSIGVLQAEDYDPPINGMVTISGIGGILTSFLGGHNANIAGPSTAITASEISGEREGRYVASLITSVLYGAFGLFAASAVAFSNALPGDLVTMLAGLAMIPVLINAFESTFADTSRYRYGAIFALIIGMSGVTVSGIGAAFWSLVGGILLSLIVEYDDWRETDFTVGGTGS
jgi:benzoate membrane transport protein